VAQVFPLNAGTGGADPAEQALARTLAGLPDEWTLLLRREIGDAEVDVVLVHPGIGVALVDLAPRRPEAAVEILRAGLDSQRFSDFFPGALPIVAVSLDPGDIEAAGERLAEAFEAAPLIEIADGDWADAVIELLLLPDDLAMAPTGIFAPPGEMTPAAAPPPPRPEPPAAPEPAPVQAVAAPVAVEERPARAGEPEVPPRPLLLDQPAVARLRLEAEDPIAYEAPERAPRRRWIGGLALAGLVIAGGVFAWGLSMEETPEEASIGTGEAQIALPPALPMLRPEVTAQAPRAKTEPPALPPAPPVLMAALAMAPPPPPAPRPTTVPPLPKPETLAAARPPAPAPAPAPPSAPSAPAAAAPPAIPMATTALPPPPPRKPRRIPRPADVAEETKPPAAPATSEETERLMRRELGESSETGPQAPPIDAADLPPLDGSAPPPPPPAPAAPAQASDPAPAIGPPVQLARQQPPAAAAEAPASDQHECRPYTAETTLTGRNVAVQGMACRDSDGKWRLVSEVPQQ
jgi:hypothetical protein